MKNLILYTSLFCGLTVISFHSSGQISSFFQSQLKSKIEVQYIHEPNKAKTTILEMLGDFIKTGTKHLFGTTDNNGMDRSAELVDAIYKGFWVHPDSSISKTASPDTKFQTILAQLLSISGKKIKVCFVNDTKGILQEFKDQYSFYYKGIMVDVPYLGEVAYQFVWPGIMVNTAGLQTIVLGEEVLQRSSLSEVKQIFLALVVHAVMGDAGPLKPSYAFLDKSLTGGKGLSLIVQSDRRKIEVDGIANALLLHYSDKFKEKAFDWFKGGRYILLPVTEASIVSVTDEGAVVPLQRYSLRDKFISINEANKGTPLAKVISKVMPDYVYYTLDELKGNENYKDNYFQFQTDFYLGFFLYPVIRAFGIEKFIDCIKFDNAKLLTTKAQLKTVFLFQNICLYLLGGKSIQYLKDNPESKEAKNVVFVLALFSYLSNAGFDVKDLAAYKKNLQFATDAADVKARGVFDDLISYYITVHQKKIDNAFMKDTPGENNDGYIHSGVAKLARIIGIE